MQTGITVFIIQLSIINSALLAKPTCSRVSLA